MSGILTLAPRLAAARRRSAAGRIDLLAVAAFGASTALLEVVVGGFHLFWQRLVAPSPDLMRALGARDAEQASLGTWVLLAGLASVLLIVPLASLSGSAARMGAMGRDRRLATLRLLGATPAEVVRLTVVETTLQAAAGAILGTLLYLVTIPAWTPLTFQGLPVGPFGLLLPAHWLFFLVVGVIGIAALAGALGLRQVQISPLGVARSSGRPPLRVVRAIVVVVLLIVWSLVGGAVTRQAEVATVFAIVATMLAVFMGVINLVGPLLVQLLAYLMKRSRSLPTRLAGFRLADDPRGAWRSVAGLAFVGFVAGTLLAMPDLSGQSRLTAAEQILITDLGTGTVLTLAISFVAAAAATTLNQVASVLDRRTQLIHLDHAGAPRSLYAEVRRAEVLAPTALAALGSAGLAASFFAPLGMLAGASALPILRLIAILAAGIGLVWAASTACRPAVSAILDAPVARAE